MTSVATLRQAHRRALLEVRGQLDSLGRVLHVQTQIKRAIACYADEAACRPIMAAESLRFVDAACVADGDGSRSLLVGATALGILPALHRHAASAPLSFLGLSCLRAAIGSLQSDAAKLISELTRMQDDVLRAPPAAVADLVAKLMVSAAAVRPVVDVSAEHATSPSLSSASFRQSPAADANATMLRAWSQHQRHIAECKRELRLMQRINRCVGDTISLLRHAVAVVESSATAAAADDGVAGCVALGLTIADACTAQPGSVSSCFDHTSEYIAGGDDDRGGVAGSGSERNARSGRDAASLMLHGVRPSHAARCVRGQASNGSTAAATATALAGGQDDDDDDDISSSLFGLPDAGAVCGQSVVEWLTAFIDCVVKT